MKKINRLLIILSIFLIAQNVFGQVASVTWPLTSNQNPNTPMGNIQALPQTIGTPASPYKLEMYPQQPYASNGQQLWTGNQGTGWIAGLPDYTRYIQFDASPTTGNDFTVQYLSFDYSDNPLNTNFNIIKAEVWYSIDGWTTKTQLNSTPLNYLNTSVQTFSKTLSVLVPNGKTFSVRIYPYTLNGGLAMTPSFATHKRLIIEGVTSKAVVNNGSICGMKFNDLNGNGRKDVGELGLNGWTINLSMGAVNMTTTTGSDGSYCFNNLPAGTYTLSETHQDGWEQTYPTNPLTHTVILTAGQNILNVDFGNKQLLGSICGMKFNDSDGNGKKDEANEGLAGWTITLSTGAVTLTTTTAADGSYCFNNLPAGTYTLSETNKDGWRQTFPASPGTQIVTLTSGQSVKDINFGNKRTLGSISGIKFNDINGTGDQQITEPPLANWIINLSGPVTMADTTDINGFYQFNNLPAGTYTITETNQPGWQQIYPSSPGSYTVVLTEGELVFSKNFANQIIPPKPGSICGKKFNDLNGNGINDNEPGIQGWVINLSNGTVQLTATTDAKGEYCFNNLLPGTYTLTETNKTGWEQTKPTSPNSYTIELTSDQNLIGIDFGNKEILNPNCTDFENNSLNGWQANNISTSFQQNGNNHYIQTTDQAGVSTFYTTSNPFIGNWTSLFSKGCGSLCFDITFIYGGDTYNGVTPPQTLNPTIALEGAGFKASFVITQSISVGDGWHSYCAPLSFLNSDGTLPSNSNGYWIMTLGTASDWNTLLTNVTKVRLLADPTSFQHEKIGYDNICLINTGDCNPPLKLGSICGIKIHDKNGDGIKDANEDGIANWPITLTIGTTVYSTTTDANGNYCFNDLPAGTYIVSEGSKEGWRQIFPAKPGTHSVTLTPGQNVTNINFSNVEDITIKLGSICGTKFNDLNGNGIKEDGELPIPNVQFNLIGETNLSTTTDINGNFCFSNLLPGTYTINEVIDNRWQPTAPNANGSISVTLTSGQNISGLNFGNKEKLGSICGIKFNDKNGNGIQDLNEPFLSNWTIKLSGTMDLTTTTDARGNFCFTNLKPGKYTISEVYKDGWTQTAPSTFTYSIELKPGETIDKLIFGNKEDVNAKFGSICGIKFNDKNGNGNQDPGELGIPDWQIDLGGPMDLSVVTDKDGHYCFNNLIPGEYKVGERARTGWRQTKPATNFYIIQLASGQNTINVDFGNTIDDKIQLGSICGNKFNDKNRDGRKVSTEPGIRGWTIYLEGPMNLTAVTDDNGNYCFYGLIPGTYTVREENKTGWRQTKPSSITYTLEITGGNNFTGIDFGNFEDPTVTFGSICGIKFNDLNGDGIKQDNEPVIPNWTINLNGTINLTVQTDSRGKFCFENLSLGRYTLSERQKDGWKQTAPSSGSYTIELSEDNSHPDLFYFGNKEDIGIRNGSICGMKYLDKNGNGKKDLTEPGIADWQINISGPVDRSIMTNKEGKYCFEDLPPGTYLIKEEPKTDWVQTDPVSPNSYTVILGSGQNLDGYYFGNKYEPKPGCVNPPYGMVAWWSFDYSSKDSPQDLAGYNNFGTKMNGPIAVAGKVAGALQFDGIDDYVEVANHADLNFGIGNFSFDAWIKTSTKTGISPLVEKRDPLSGKGYEFFLHNGNLGLQLADASLEDNYIPSLFVGDGNWHHIAITVSRANKNGIIFYLDGTPTPYGDPTLHSGSLNNTNPLRIGRELGTFFPSQFNGILDEIELFKRVLTPAEVQAIYNAGSAGKCKQSGSLTSVWGHVFHDINLNGVIDEKDPNLSNWTVLINGPTVETTNTDMDGNFSFINLKPGNYTISVVKPNNWFQTFPFKGNYSVQLDIDQSIDAINFGFANDACLSGLKSWSPLGIGTSLSVNALVAKGNDLFVGGDFVNAGGLIVNHIAKWNDNIWSDLNGGVNGPINALLVVGNDLYVGGSFTMAGNISAKNIAKWNGSSWSALGDGTNGTVQALAMIGNDLYVGGLFTTAGLTNAKNIAKWNGINWIALGAGVNQNASGVHSLTAIGTDLYVGGGFWGTGGANGTHNVVKWNTINSTWSPLAAGLNSTVYALTVMNGELYAAGDFTNAIGFNSINHIAKWDGTSWLQLDNGTTGGVSGANWAVTAVNNELYVGGNFTNAGSVSANAIAKWDGSNWASLGNGFGTPYYRTVRAIAVVGSDIYAGGVFSTADGVTVNNIARYSCFSTVTSIDDDNINEIIPHTFNLDQNYPNPFNPTTTIRFNISKIGLVKISVYDILGREVRVLVNEEKKPGVYSITFDAKNLASGIYFYTIRTGEYFQSKKMILLK